MNAKQRGLANLRPFKPGQSGNPLGRQTVLPPEVRSARKQNQVALIRKIGELFMMNDADAETRFRAAETTQLEKAIQGMIGKAREGDTSAFRYLVELMVGKIPDHDYDGFSEEDLRILNRVKEVIAQQQPDDGNDRAGH